MYQTTDISMKPTTQPTHIPTNQAPPSPAAVTLDGGPCPTYFTTLKTNFPNLLNQNSAECVFIYKNWRKIKIILAFAYTFLGNISENVKVDSAMLCQSINNNVWPPICQSGQVGSILWQFAHFCKGGGGWKLLGRDYHFCNLILAVGVEYVITHNFLAGTGTVIQC